MTDNEYRALSLPISILHAKPEEAPDYVAPTGAYHSTGERRAPRLGEYVLVNWEEPGYPPAPWVCCANHNFGENVLNYIIMRPGLPDNPAEPHNPEE